ncbi:MAG TPA: T9SS type A sorting domain-containing protein [Candidatus Coatesbacteria bacterium]|nr:T9SS type A sorting domain-containing protein [Candidatus Coatesbacteria bacterium]
MKWVVPLLFLLVVPVLANPDGIPITRLAEGAPPLEMRDEYMARRTPYGEPNFVTRYRGPAGPGDDLYILVNEELHPKITANLGIWVADLEAEGYTVTVATSGPVSPEELRAELQARWALGMDGAILIGDFDSAWFEGVFWPEIGYENFPCDLFLMDLDGHWSEKGSPDGGFNGIYDIHTDGSGDMEPDIYFGRVPAHNLSLCGDEDELVNAWLERNHDYRTGDWPLERNSMTYVDHDWADWGYAWSAYVGYVYPGNETNVWPDVTAQGYMDRLNDVSYEHILVCCHSSPAYHAFHTGGNVSNAYVNYTDHRWAVHNLFACSNARYTTDNNMGGVYALDPDSMGLISVGSTKTGSMLEFHEFYGAVRDGMTWGEAFRHWFSLVAEGKYGGWTQQDARGWFYGMTLIGDPTLKPTAYSSVEVASFRADPIDGGALVSWRVERPEEAAGYNLYRLAEDGVSRERLNERTFTGGGPWRYLDTEADTGRVAYLLEVLEGDGSSTFYGPAECELKGPETIRTELLGTFPNPTDGLAAVSFELSGADAGEVSVALYDTAGRRVMTVHSGTLPAGRHVLAFDASGLAGGVYLLRLEAGAAVRTTRLVVVR